MLEKHFQTKFGHWLKSGYRKTACFELKLCKGTSMPFSVVQQHQLDALFAAKHNVLYYKISDSGLGQKPLDCFMLAGVPAFVVVKFEEAAYLIDIDVFLKEKETSLRKSLTENRAREIASRIIE